jgi:spore coat protein U-like protein
MKTKLNQSKLKLAIVSAMLLGTAGITAPAYALDASLSVSASIDMSCSITTTPLTFGDYEPGSTHATAPLNAQGGVSSTCTTGSVGNIKMGQGENTTGTSSTDAMPLRRMVAAGDATSFLNYGVFTDTDRMNAWENSIGVSYEGTGLAQALVVYGSVQPGQTSAVVGSYTDTITVAINY